MKWFLFFLISKDTLWFFFTVIILPVHSGHDGINFTRDPSFNIWAATACSHTKCLQKSCRSTRGQHVRVACLKVQYQQRAVVMGANRAETAQSSETFLLILCFQDPGCCKLTTKSRGRKKLSAHEHTTHSRYDQLFYSSLLRCEDK